MPTRLITSSRISKKDFSEGSPPSAPVEKPCLTSKHRAGMIFQLADCNPVPASSGTFADSTFGTILVRQTFEGWNGENDYA